MAAMDSTMDEMNVNNTSPKAEQVPAENRPRQEDSEQPSRGEDTREGEQSTPSLADLTKTLTSLAKSLQSVKDNQDEMAQVMIAAGAKPLFGMGPKNKGVGKRSRPARDEQPREIPGGSRPRHNSQSEPPAKRSRREPAYDLHARESDLDYSDDPESDDEEVEFTSDDVEQQIDAFLSTATYPARSKQKPLLPLSPKKPHAPPSVVSKIPVPQPPVQVDLQSVDELFDEGLASFAQDLATDEDVGPDMNPQLANIFTNLLGKKLSDEKVKQKIEENPPPRNIPLLHPPRVNECIWELLKAAPRSTDIRMRKIQVRLTRGLVALARLTEEVVKAKKRGTSPDLQEYLNMSLQAFALIGNANYELSLRRRETLRSQLNPQYSRLCYPSTPVTTDLFGDDITKLVEDITKVQKLGANLAGRNRNNNNSYGHGSGYNKNYKKNNNNNNYNSKKGGNHKPKNGKWRGNGQNQQKNNQRQ